MVMQFKKLIKLVLPLAVPAYTEVRHQLSKRKIRRVLKEKNGITAVRLQVEQIQLVANIA